MAFCLAPALCSIGFSQYTLYGIYGNSSCSLVCVILQVFDVQEALNVVMAERTVIVIAHRLSTVRNVDSIAVMEHGRILEKGTHDALMSFDGHYAGLVHQQEQY